MTGLFIKLQALVHDTYVNIAECSTCIFIQCMLRFIYIIFERGKYDDLERTMEKSVCAIEITRILRNHQEMCI